MYVGMLIFLAGTPLALGSYWGLVVLILSVIVFAFRILDEEKMLEEELNGYIDYTREVQYRLVAHVWHRGTADEQPRNPIRDLEGEDMKTALQAATTSIIGFAAFLLSGCCQAGAFDDWQGCAFSALFAAATTIPSIYLAATNPAALKRRMQAGPAA